MGDDTRSGGGRWTLFQIFIAILMVVTGSINTLAAKWADRLEVDGRKFDHPFVQAVGMFIGEFLCLPAFAITFIFQKWRYRKRRLMKKDIGPLGPIDSDLVEPPQDGPPTVTNFNPLIFFPAAMCDMVATSVTYVALNLTSAASFQMLRGAVIIFTGLLSVAFLRSVLRCYKWVGMAGVFFGLVIVGLSDILCGEGISDDVNGVISGDLLVVMAQIIVAVQMVYEQKFIIKYNVPALLAVGLEGLWGMTVLSLLCIPFYYVRVPQPFTNDPENRLENALNAFFEMKHNHLIVLALVGTVLSIAFFNFAGISVTKELSATTRMVLDSVRVLVIWAASLTLQWQNFVAPQLLGFILLIFGMFVYNDVIFGPWFRGSFLPWLNKKGIVLTPIQRCCFPDLTEEEEQDRSDLIRPGEDFDENPIL